MKISLIQNNSIWNANQNLKNASKEGQHKNSSTIDTTNSVSNSSRNSYIKSLEKQRSQLEEEIKKIQDSNLSEDEKTEKIKSIQENMNKISETLLKENLTNAISKGDKIVKEIEGKKEEEEAKKLKTKDESRQIQGKYLVSMSTDLEHYNTLKRLRGSYSGPDNKAIKERIESVMNTKVSEIQEKIRKYAKNVKLESEKTVEEKEEQEDKNSYISVENNNKLDKRNIKIHVDFKA